MKEADYKPPIVLVLGGHDPSGAGIQADIETCNAMKCYPVSIVTCTTNQNFKSIINVSSCLTSEVLSTIDTVLEEFTPKACKLGMIGSLELVIGLGEMIQKKLKKTPIVVDPVLASGSGKSVANQEIIDAYLKYVVPQATIVTPNLDELCKLGGSPDSLESISHILSSGCQALLATDINPTEPTITNYLYRAEKKSLCYEMVRYRGTYHGTGCTLASGIAAQLALGENLETAIEKAQQFVHLAVERAMDFGLSQKIPNRLN
jgi:hydroxymethylpyrimidine/phosphomethylpyrimidine kinase